MLNLKKYRLTTELFDIRFFKAESLKLVNFLKKQYLSIWIYIHDEQKGGKKQERKGKCEMKDKSGKLSLREIGGWGGGSRGRLVMEES